MALIKGLPVLVYDLEVFAYNFMAVFKDSETGVYYKYHNSVDEGIMYGKDGSAVGMAPEITTLINDYWLCGYNNLGYDNMILTAMIKNPNPQNVKFRNDSLFKHMHDNNVYNRTKPIHARRRYTDNKRFPVFRSIKSIDAMQEIVADEFKDNMMGISLKYIEGNLGINIHETPISFDIKRALTDEEVDLVMGYCTNDVDVTEMVMNARWEDYFETKMFLCNKLSDWSFEFAMTQRTTTLTGHLLKNDNKFDFFKMLDDLNDKGLMTPMMYEYWSKGYVPGDADDDGLTVDYFDNTIKFKWGGIHGVHNKQKYFQGRIYHIDVASMYPSIIILLKILGDDANAIYKGLRDQRVIDKHAGNDAAANGAKLILNKLYGILGSATSKVSNIGGLNAICVYGQVAMYNIGKLVAPYGTIIQFNTDGIYFLPNDDITKGDIEEILKPWEEAFQLEMDIEEYTSIAQRDVNTYVAIDIDGKAKTKGEISSAKDSWRNMFKSWNASVVEKAVVNYLTEGTSIHETINSETDIRRFQYIVKNTRAMRGVINMDTGEEEEQKVNRFVVVNSGGATYKNVKVTKLETLKNKKTKLEQKIKELELLMPEYEADMANKELYPTKKALAVKWKTGPAGKLKNAMLTLEKVEADIAIIEGGDEIVTYSKVTGLPEVEGRVLLCNEDITVDHNDLLYKIDRQHYIDSALELAVKFGV